MKFEHEYDYGTSTYLELVVKGKDMQAIRLPSKAKPGKIEVLVRYDPIRFVCNVCGGDATLVCNAGVQRVPDLHPGKPAVRKVHRIPPVLIWRG